MCASGQCPSQETGAGSTCLTTICNPIIFRKPMRRCAPKWAVCLRTFGQGTKWRQPPRLLSVRRCRHIHRGGPVRTEHGTMACTWTDAHYKFQTCTAHTAQDYTSSTHFAAGDWLHSARVRFWLVSVSRRCRMPLCYANLPPTKHYASGVIFFKERPL